jgi:hypothetical protein
LPISSSIRTLRAGFLAVVMGLTLGSPAASQKPALQYPDLRPLPSQFVLVDFLPLEGVTHYVLRFTATIWNAGAGPLELHGESTPEHHAFQRIYDDAGGFKDAAVSGGFTFFEPHQHWHFENFAEYQLWPKNDFDRWLASGRQQGQPRWQGSKTTGQTESFCIRDSQSIKPLEGTPVEPYYIPCDQALQGISVGWGDTYPFTLPEQWIDLGLDDLPDGTYVLRVVADPGQILDQGGRNDVAPNASEALTVFTVTGPETEVLTDPYSTTPE